MIKHNDTQSLARVSIVFGTTGTCRLHIKWQSYKQAGGMRNIQKKYEQHGGQMHAKSSLQ
jgi:hypothetical protein